MTRKRPVFGAAFKAKVFSGGSKKVPGTFCFLLFPFVSFCFLAPLVSLAPFVPHLLSPVRKKVCVRL
jgi:hypothetical protein